MQSYFANIEYLRLVSIPSDGVCPHTISSPLAKAVLSLILRAVVKSPEKNGQSVE